MSLLRHVCGLRRFTTTYIQIGSVRRQRGTLSPSTRPELLALDYLSRAPSPSINDCDTHHLQWMLQKDILGQDMCLIGPPGSSAITRRRLAMMYAELLQREVQTVTITSDLTESDLKQRRELTALDDSDNHKKQLQLTFSNAAPVDAAIHGRILILDGLEKASRNVLPTLNNLVEHRTMNLEDGRILVPANHHLKGHDSSRIIPVHPNFRVIALAVPPPLGHGHLDPPLRSRFQMRRINDEIMLASDMSQEWLQIIKALELAAQEDHKIWPFPSNQLGAMARLVRTFPNQHPVSIFMNHYPMNDRMVSTWNKLEPSQKALNTALVQVLSHQPQDTPGTPPRYQISSILRDESDPNRATVTWTCRERPKNWFSAPSEQLPVQVSVPCGEQGLNHHPPSFLLTDGLRHVVLAMLQAHAVGNDILLLSPRGESKSGTAGYFASLLGYTTRLIQCHPEMTLTDMFLRRVTKDSDGATAWESSTLLKAIQDGHLCIMDHVDKLRPDVLSSLQALLTDRDFFLPDGRRILKVTGSDPSLLDNPNVVRVHPSFRVLALGSPSKVTSSSFFSQDVISMMSTIVIPPPTVECTRAILHSVHPECSTRHVDQLLALRSLLTDEVARDCGVSVLSTRNLIRIVKRLKTTSIRDAVGQVLVSDLLPPTQKAALESVLAYAGMGQKPDTKRRLDRDTVTISDGKLSIGDFTMDQKQVVFPQLVPSPSFFDIPNHVQMIKDLLVDWKSGERAFLLLGNQGVGKNMIIDRLCELANFEREYIQLHRDSTIGQITLQPSLEDGKIVWHDSPLVRSALHGLSLVVDEADKAPMEVLSVLKGLVEDGELALGDGRRISRNDDGAGIIRLHPDCTIWVLANRPGFPFLGNPFFKQIGDCFSTRIVANPDIDSEVALLRSYGPSLDDKSIRQIAGSFSELRSLADRGDLSYPYSTREAVAVVKHLEKFPEDGVVTALHNVLDFDSFDPLVYDALRRVFQRHGIAVQDYQRWQDALRKQGQNLSIEFSTESSNRTIDGMSDPPPLSSPKEGKWDDNNDPHVGGNQWAGGTGGSDTAGLGGRGGPYRLDRGHPVHQVGDEAKAQVSEESRRLARAMSEKALKTKLEDINMSETEWDMYRRFADPIQKDVANLRALLKHVDLRHDSEEGWLKRQSHGELDESRLVDGITGEQHIYKRRGIVEEFAPASRPKRLRFVVDVSGSMYRFNGYDGRLVRCLEATNLIMESFDGMKDRFDYSIVGHSGDSPCIRFVDFGQPPKDEKQRMKILQSMIAHTQYCEAGDHTLEAMEQAIQDVSDTSDNQTAMTSLVIGISDANLERYGIQPRELGRIMLKGEEHGVLSHCIFIASLGEAATEIQRALPRGRGHVCMQTSDLPRIVRNILAAHHDV